MEYNSKPRAAKGRFPADARAVGSALELVRKFVANARCGKDLEASLAIVVEELVTNIVEHGDPPPGSEIWLEIVRERERVSMTLSDAGRHFDIRTAPPPSELPPERGGGAGIALVLQWARIEGYEAVDGRNVLKLVISGHV